MHKLRSFLRSLCTIPAQQESINYAKQFGWTAAAEKAYIELELKAADEHALLNALVNFAGPTLLKRQQLQFAQKGLVTKRDKNQTH